MPAAPLAVSLGDPAGIAPEVIAQAWTLRDREGLAPFLVVGGAGVLRAAALTRGIDLPVTPISDAREAMDAFDSGLPVLGGEDCAPSPGQPTPDGARVALHSLTRATALAL